MGSTIWITDGWIRRKFFFHLDRLEVIDISELHDTFEKISDATKVLIVGSRQMDAIGKMISATMEAQIQNELEQKYKDLNVESQGDLFEDLLKVVKEFDLLDDLALVPEPPKQDISTLKKRIKYCKNPMEKKKLEQELNALYKEHKRNRRTT